MPLPITALMTPAVRLQRPIARINDGRRVAPSTGIWVLVDV